MREERALAMSLSMGMSLALAVALAVCLATDMPLIPNLALSLAMVFVTGMAIVLF